MHSDTVAESTSAARLIAWTTLLAGAVYGWVGAGWQSLVEPSQVLAGLVHYPVDNLDYLYLIKIPVLQHHLVALMLRGGLDEVAVSRVASAFTTGFLFQAWGLLAFALSRSRALGLAAPFLVVSSLAGLRGLDYSINFPPEDYGYGPLTLTLLALAIAYLAMGWERAAGFVAGVLPSTYPILGLWGVGLFGAMMMAEAWSSDRVPWRLALWTAIGFALSVLGVAAHILVYYPAGPIFDNSSRDFVFAFSRLHDGHRARFGPSLTLLSITASLALTIAYAARAWPQMTIGMRRALAVLALNAVLGALATSVYWWPENWIPLALFSAMPNRFLNLNAMMFAPFALGAAASLDHEDRAAAVIAVLAGLLGFDALFLGGGALDRGTASTIALIGAAAVLIIVWWRHRLADRSLWIASASLAAIGAGVLAIAVMPRAPVALPAHFAAAAWGLLGAGFIGLAAVAPRLRALVAGSGERARHIVWIGLAAGVAAIAIDAVALGRSSDERFVYYANDAALAAAHRGSGDLLFLKEPVINVGAQLWTRRPLVIDPNIISALPYMGENGKAMMALLHDLYGFDLLSPDPACNAYDSPCVRAIWTGRSAQEWRALAQRFDFTEILVPAEVTLNLATVAESPRFRLYRVGD